jgi:hypothetical protein
MRQRLKGPRLALPGFFILSLLMTWPLGFSAGKGSLGENLDLTAALYNLWWFFYSVVKLQVSPWWNPLINFPHGYSMVFYPVHFPYGLFSLPFQLLLPAPQGVTLAYNLALVLSFTLTGYFTFLLARDLTGSARAGAVAGLIFAFCPYHFWALSRPHVVSTEFLALAALFLLRTLRSERNAPALALGLALALLAYASPTYLIYFFLFAGLGGIFLLVADRPLLLRRSFARQMLLTGLVLVPLFFPLLYRLLRDYLGQAVPLSPEESLPLAYSGNLLGYFLPGETQDLYRRAAASLPSYLADLKRPYGVGGYETFLGYTALALGLLAAIRRRQQGTGLWIFTALVFFLLSLGPRLHAGAHTFLAWPLPQAWLSAVLPVLREDRSPVRYLVLAELSLALLAGFGLAALRDRLSDRRHLALTAGLSVLVLAEFSQAPLALSPIPVPAFYQRLADEPGDFAVLDLPLLPDVYRYSGTYQRFHLKRLVIDLTGRKSDERTHKDPLFRYLDLPARFFSLSLPEQARAQAEIRREMTARRLRYVILYRRFLTPAQAARLTELLRRLGPVEERQEEGLFVIFKFAPGETGAAPGK